MQKWARRIVDGKSTLWYFAFVFGNLVTWSSEKQKVVALSIAEGDFRSMAKALCELLWLKRLLEKIGYSRNSAMYMFCDNKSIKEIA